MPMPDATQPQPSSVLDNETKEYASHVVALSDDEQMKAMMKEAEALEIELGYVSPEKAAQEEAVKKEKETDAPKFYDYVNKAGVAIAEEAKATAQSTIDVTLGQSMTDVGRGLVGGFTDFAEGVGNTFIDSINALEAWGKTRGVDINMMPDDAMLDFAKDVLPPKNPAEQTIRKIGQYLIPFGGSMKVLKGGSALVQGVKASVSGALISAATTDPEDAHLSDMIKDLPFVPDLAVSMAEYLQSSPGDSRAESRFKTFAESLILDSTLSGAFFGISKAAKLSKDTYRSFKAGLNPVAEESAEEAAKAGAKGAAAGGETGAVKAGAKGAAAGGETGAVKPKPEPRPKIIGPDGKPMPSPVTKLREIIGPKPTDKVVAKMRDANTTEAMMTALRENPGSDTIDNLINSARRGVQGDDQVKANAQTILQNREQVEKLIMREAGVPMNAEEITATRMLWEREFLGLQNLRIKDVKNASPEQLALFQEQFNRFIGVGAQVKGASAEMGRGLRTLQQAVEAAPDDAARLSMMNKYMDINGGPDSIKDAAEILNTILDMKPEDMIENAMKIQKRSLIMRTGDAMAQAWMEGIFWSPKTQAANLIGNVFSTLDNIAVTSIQRGAARVGMAEEIAVNGEVASSLKGMWQGMIEGFGAMKTYMSEGELQSAVSKFGKIEQNITPEVFGVPETSWLGKTIQSIGYSSSLGLRATTAMDIMFRHTNFRMRTNQLLTREAVQLGLEGKAAQDYVKSKLGNVPDNIIKNAQKYAEASIFAKPLDEVAFGGAIQSFGDLADKIPMGRAIFPFMRFGGNLADYMMQRTPGISYISPEFRMAMKAGGSRKQEALAKLGLGTSLIGLGAYMAGTGTMTGGGPKDYTTRKALNAGDKGWQPYTLRTDDGNSYSISRLAPHGLILGMGADIAEMIGALGDDNKQAQYDIIGAAVGIFGTYFTPAIVADFGDFFGGLKESAEGQPLSTTAAKSMGRYFTGMVPFSGMTKELSKLTNDGVKFDTTPGPSDEKTHMESLWKVWEATKNEWLANNPLPGFSPGLPPQLNIFGETVHYPPGVGPDLISPIFANAPEGNKAREEMERLGMSGPFARQKPQPGGDILRLSMPDRFLSKTGKKAYQIKLSPEQYHRYTQLSAGIDLGVERTLQGEIEYQVANKWPAGQESFGRDIKTGDVTDAAKIVLIKTIVSQYRKAAGAKMYQEFPELANKLNEYGSHRGEALGVDFAEGDE